MKKRKYYEALTKDHDIERFWADNNCDAVIIACQNHYLSVVRIRNNKMLTIGETVLHYKSDGYDTKNIPTHLASMWRQYHGQE